MYFVITLTFLLSSSYEIYIEELKLLIFESLIYNGFGNRIAFCCNTLFKKKDKSN